jgi:hypothetical protein
VVLLAPLIDDRHVLPVSGERIDIIMRSLLPEDAG